MSESKKPIPTHLINRKPVSGTVGGHYKHGWYRGDTCNFAPRLTNIGADAKELVREQVLKGWVPDVPFLTKETPILAFGSCFAASVTNHLDEQGYTLATRQGYAATVHNFAYNGKGIHFGAGVNNTFALKQVFDHVFNDILTEERTSHDENGELILHPPKLVVAGNEICAEKFRDKALVFFERTDVFILTLGLSEVWQNKETKEVFWRSLPEDQFRPDVHEFKVSTVEENKANIQYVYDLIKEKRPEAKVIFTVSPVSLVATFRPVTCITANNVSKSILRAAVDEMYRENDGDNNPDLWYWPSYEIVEKFYPNPYRTDGDTRHITKECTKFIMEEFERAYSLVYGV